MGGTGGRWVRVAWRFGPPVLWMAVMGALSTDAFSAEHTGRYLLPFLHWLRPGATPDTIELLHVAIRKAMHLCEYGILALLWYQALRRPEAAWQTPVGLTALGLAVALAAVDEFHQAFVPSRSGSMVDVGWDSLGAALALTVCCAFQCVRRVTPEGIRINGGREEHASGK